MTAFWDTLKNSSVLFSLMSGWPLKNHFNLDFLKRHTWVTREKDIHKYILSKSQKKKNKGKNN